MLDWLRSLTRRSTEAEAAVKPSSSKGKSTGSGVLPPVEVPSGLKAGQQTAPSYLRTAKPDKNAALPRTDSAIINKDLETYRTGVDTRQVVRDFAAASPDLSAAVNAYLRTAITAGYTAVAKNMDGTFSRDGTALLQQLLTRFDVVQDYSDGFSGVNSLRSTSEQLGKEGLLYGAMGLELVLGKDRLPRTLQPVSVTQIKFYPDKSGKWLRPVQTLGGEDIDLDIPTFFYVSLDQSLLDAYATSPLEPALQPALWAITFMNDLRRIVKRAIHPRMNVSIDWEKFMKQMPESAKETEEATASYMAATIEAISTKINELQVEDALVTFDTLEVDYLNNGNISLKDEYQILNDIMDAKLATGAKVLPSILGHGKSTQNIASSETLLFMKNAEGTTQLKLNEIYSRALTLAVRLYGLDVYVEFSYAKIDLRPESELEAFRTMKQSRVLDLLSLGFISDDQASIDLTGQMTPAGFKPLSGTQFRTPAPADPIKGKDSAHSNTGSAGKQDSKPGTPTRAKGPQKAEDETPALTAKDVQTIVSAAVAGMPAFDENAVLEAVGEAAKKLTGELYEVAGALNADLTKQQTDTQAAREEVSDLAKEVRALASVPAPAPVVQVSEPAPPAEIHLTIVNEAAKTSANKTVTISRGPDGKLQGSVTEVPDA